MINAPENYILCEIKEKFKDKEGSILIDPTWFPEEHATLEGIVVSIPIRTGSDGYRKIIGSVKVSDKIFFSYSVIFKYKLQPEDDTPVYSNLIIYEGKEYWKVNIDEVFFKVENEEVEMITDNILVSPLSGQSGIVAAIPNIPLEYKVGDRIIFEPSFVQVYSFFGRTYFIIPCRRAIAKII